MLQILELPPLQGNHHLLQLLKLYRASSVVRRLTETDRCVLPAICPVKFVENGHFARACRSKGSSNDFASAAITAPVPSVHRLFLASAPSSLGSAVLPGTLNDSPVQVLIDSGVSENFVDFDVCCRLNLPVNGDRSSIGMASSAISVETLGKTTADLILLDRTYPSSNFRILKNLCADAIVGQTFLRQHSSITFVMNGQNEA